VEELIQGQIQQLNNTSASANEEIVVLQIEMNRFRNLFYELQQNQTVIEKLQRQIQELMEINTTLHMEIMTVRASAEQETTSLQTKVNSLRSLLFDSKTTRLFLKNCRGE